MPIRLPPYRFGPIVPLNDGQDLDVHIIRFGREQFPTALPQARDIQQRIDPLFGPAMQAGVLRHGIDQHHATQQQKSAVEEVTIVVEISHGDPSQPVVR